MKMKWRVYIGMMLQFYMGWSREASLIKCYLGRELKKMGKQIYKKQHARQREQQV